MSPIIYLIHVHVTSLNFVYFFGPFRVEGKWRVSHVCIEICDQWTGSLFKLSYFVAKTIIMLLKGVTGHCVSMNATDNVWMVNVWVVFWFFFLTWTDNRTVFAEVWKPGRFQYRDYEKFECHAGFLVVFEKRQGKSPECKTSV